MSNFPLELESLGVASEDLTRLESVIHSKPSAEVDDNDADAEGAVLDVN